MNTPLQLREVFHLEFLRWFSKEIKPVHYALKGGANLRFFFNSFRYSEDIDFDISGIRIDMLRDKVIKILQNPTFQNNLRPSGIESIKIPDIAKSKQTPTTQRFKIHLITFAGEDLFTKIEFSRRGLKGGTMVKPVSDKIMRSYKFPPLLISHYDIYSAIVQKIEALASRPVVQARDIFDLYILSSQYEGSKEQEAQVTLSKNKLLKAYENIFDVGFEQFRDTVTAYLSAEDRPTYDNASSWDEVKLKTAEFLKGLIKKYG